MARIEYVINPSVTNGALNHLFAASWPDHTARDFATTLERSLVYVCAFDGERLLGFLNVAWDGGLHAFLLDTTVHPGYRRQGIGLELVRRAVEVARTRDIEWVHVDFAPELRPFYERAGFKPTEAGLIRLPQ